LSQYSTIFLPVEKSGFSDAFLLSITAFNALIASTAVLLAFFDHAKSTFFPLVIISATPFVALSLPPIQVYHLLRIVKSLRNAIIHLSNI